MNFKHLFEEQKKLDKTILDKHNKDRDQTFIDRIMALSVELSECMNETRCFKYWSNKGCSPKGVVLEEYVDIIHFLLSLGIDVQAVNIENLIIDREYKPTHTKTSFSENYFEINNFLKEMLEFKDNEAALWATYIQLFESVLDLGYKLGFGFKDIEDMYYKKNAINYKRQEVGY